MSENEFRAFPRRQLSQREVSGEERGVPEYHQGTAEVSDKEMRREGTSKMNA